MAEYGQFFKQGEYTVSMTPEQELKNLTVQFKQLRASDCRAYPLEVWQKAVTLTKVIPTEAICQAILVQPAYLRKKIREFEEPTMKGSDFLEIKTGGFVSSESLIIDLETPSGFKAKIQGSSSCLGQVLASFFQEGSCSR